jgi:hypothetical protein
MSWPIDPLYREIKNEVKRHGAPFEMKGRKRQRQFNRENEESRCRAYNTIWNIGVAQPMPETRITKNVITRSQVRRGLADLKDNTVDMDKTQDSTVSSERKGSHYSPIALELTVIMLEGTSPVADSSIPQPNSITTSIQDDD